MDERTMYVLNLNQRRLIVVCVLLTGLLCTSFGLGILLGVRSNPGKPVFSRPQVVTVDETNRNSKLLPATMDRTPIKESIPTQVESRVSPTDTLITETQHRVAKHAPKKGSKGRSKSGTRVVPRNLAGYKPSLNIQLFVTKDLKRIRLLESELQKKTTKQAS